MEQDEPAVRPPSRGGNGNKKRSRGSSSSPVVEEDPTRGSKGKTPAVKEEAGVQEEPAALPRPVAFIGSPTSLETMSGALSSSSSGGDGSEDGQAALLLPRARTPQPRPLLQPQPPPVTPSKPLAEQPPATPMPAATAAAAPAASEDNGGPAAAAASHEDEDGGGGKGKQPAAAAPAASSAAFAPTTGPMTEAEDRRMAERLFLEINRSTRPPRRGPAVTREARPGQTKARLLKLLKEVLQPEWVEVREIKPRPNAFYEQLRAAAPHLAESLVVHGTKKEYAEAIAQEGFNPDKILFCGDDGTTTDRFFFFATCPGIAERWRKEDEATPDGRVLRHLVVSLLIWLPEACIKLSGCTGGTIKVPQHAHRFLQPAFSVRYRTERTAHLATFPPGVSHKHQLEAAPDFVLEQAILKHMIPTRGDIDAAFLSQFR